nr:hypothetical protein [uncultured Pseudodesulfovibrio sp.]
MKKKLKKMFEDTGVDTSTPGFYNDKNFIAQEQNDPSFLQAYGFWVYYRNYSDKYLKKVKSIVPTILSVVQHELVEDGRMGACVDVSQVLSKILERHGIWCVMVEGAFNADYPDDANISEKYLWHFDDPKSLRERLPPGHVWLHCPPYQVVDITIKQQPYTEGQSDYLPEIVAQEEVDIFDAKVGDICSPEVRSTIAAMGLTPKVFMTQSGVDGFSELVRPVSFEAEQTTLRYIPISFTASDGELENMGNLILSGRNPCQLYTDKVLPALQELENKGTPCLFSCPPVVI